ncbi:hypothetical protein, partial [Larkinella arboricola]|uniref:hypothetical protein n=1 Tax=Larkinella arboricola TaxID=643671 RepID=UPI001B87ACA3
SDLNSTQVRLEAVKIRQKDRLCKAGMRFCLAPSTINERRPAMVRKPLPIDDPLTVSPLLTTRDLATFLNSMSKNPNQPTDDIALLKNWPLDIVPAL